MGFNSTDIKQKQFEVYKSQAVPPENYIVARLDGVTFSKVTKALGLRKPFDHGFMDKMLATTQYLMDQVPDVEVAYTQSDEITLVFRRDTDYFNRRTEKLASILAARAASHMSIQLGTPVAFDGRLSVFPTQELVDENLTWRIEDAAKNCRNLYVFWGMIAQGMTERQATKAMLGQGKDFYNEWIFQNLGINYNDIDAREKRGSLLYRVPFYRVGYNPHDDVYNLCTRSEVVQDHDIPRPSQESPLTRVHNQRYVMSAESYRTAEARLNDRVQR